MAQADGLLMQTDDIHSVKLPGTSWLVHVAYAANKLAALYLNGWLVSTSYSETLHLPQLHLIYATSAAAVCLYMSLKYSQHSICACFAAAAIIYNSNNQQQQQRSRSIPPIPNTLTFSYPSPCQNLQRVVMIELHSYVNLIIVHHYKRTRNYHSTSRPLTGRINRDW